MKTGRLQSLSKQISLALIIAMILSIIPYNNKQVSAVDVSNFSIIWSSAFGGAGNDEAFSIIAVNKASEDDNVVEGYVISGTDKDETGLEYTSLIKTDKEGGVLWEKKYGGIFLSSGRSVSRTRDGGFIIAGTSKTYMESYDKVYVIKTDAEGNLQWERKLDLEAQGYLYSKRQGFSIKEVDDGYVIAGTIIRGDTSDALMIKTNSVGAVSWAKVLGGMQWDWFYDVEAVSDGYIAGGFTERDNKYYEYLVKVDAAGGLNWEHIGSVPGSHIKNIAVSDDGTLVATGYRNLNISMMKFDSNKNFYWENSYDAGIGYGVAPLGSGDYVIAGNNKIIGVKADGRKAWVRDLSAENSFVKSVVIGASGSMFFAGSKNQNGNGDAYIFELGTDRASLGVSVASVLKESTIYLYSPVYQKNGELFKATNPNDPLNPDVRVKIMDGGEESLVQLKDTDPAFEDDFGYLDGIYSGSYKVKGTDKVELELYVDGIKEDSKTINVITDPDLVVLTDYKKLYKEFVDTGMDAGDDKNSNRKPDFYDLMERVRRYAQEHKGIVVDVCKEISIENGWSKNYSDYSYESNAGVMAKTIDTFVKTISDISRFNFVSILGDDEVIPFYRKNDPIFDAEKGMTYEEQYVPDDMSGKYWGNPTLAGTWNKSIMTDVVYGSYNDFDPDTVPFPIPDAGVGRIFADQPITLIDMINGYETPINLIPEKSKTMIFGLDSDLRDHAEGVDFPRGVKNALIPVLETKYKKPAAWIAPPYRDGYYYWYDGTLRDWGGELLKGAIETAGITLLWSHANHFFENTQGFPNITYSTFSNMNSAPGHLFINAGCHSGYTVSHNNNLQSGESYEPYDKAMVNSIISKQVAYFAPSVYGLSANDTATCHDLLESNFLKALIGYGAGTTGQRLVDAYWGYRNDYGFTANNESIYAAYGTIYYGLPTQKTVTTEAELAALQNANRALQADGRKLSQLSQKSRNLSTANNAAASRNMSISVDIPEFKRTMDASGKVSYDIPNNKNYTKTSFAPILPLILKTYQLPKGSSVDRVILENQVNKVVEEQIELKTLVPINKTLGKMQGSFELTNLYPAEIFTWNQEERADGVYLNVLMTPMQYNPNTKQVTLYESIDLKVDYSTPMNATSITEVIINNGSGVNTGVMDVPISVKINSDSDQLYQMEWGIRDTSGLVIESGSKAVSLTTGENQATFSFDVTDWSPGQKDLTVSLKGDSLITSHFSVIPVSGLSLDIQMNERVYDPTDEMALFSAEVRDENGLVVRGLGEDKFNLSIDGSISASATISETGEGFYRFQIPISQLTENVHRLGLTCTDTNNHGRSAGAEEDFVVRTDTKPPEVVRTKPSQYEAGVALSEKVVIEFDELIFPAGAYENIKLSISSSEGDRNIDITNSISYEKLIITPDDKLALDTVYEIVIPDGAVMDKKGNALKYPYTYKFITYAEPDTIAPKVLSVEPTGGTSGFPSKAAIIINFSESISDGTNAAQITWLANDQAISYDTEYYASELILTPKEQLPFNTGCKVTLPAGSINDLSGNTLESEFSYDFSIESGPDTKEPTLIRVVPEQNESSALVYANVNIKFDEAIKKGVKINDLLLTDSEGTQIPFTADVQRETLTIKTQRNLELNKEYKINIPSAAVTDLAGNLFTASREFVFSTGEPIDTRCPVVIETAPSDKADTVLVDAGIYVYFDEAILQGGNYGQIALYDITDMSSVMGNSVGVDVRIYGNTLTLIPEEELKYGSNFRVKVPAGALKDLNENSITSDILVEFSTADVPDTVPPEVISTTPLADSLNIPVNTQIVFAFDEVLKEGDSYADIKITGGGNSISHTKVINGKKLILSVSGLPYSTNVTVSMPAGAVSDLFGNAIEGCDINFVTVAAPSGGNGGGGPGSYTGTGNGDGQKIIVKGSINDFEQFIINITGEKESGEGFISVNVNDTLLNEKLQKESDKSVISFSVGNAENFRFIGITGQTVKTMELKEAVIEINTGLATFTIPARLFKIDDIASGFGKNIDLKEMEVNIQISSAKESITEIIKNIALKDGFQIIVPSVEFSIECSYKGKIIEVDRFSAPVERTIPIPEGVKLESITTAVMVEKDGTLSHAATKIIKLGDAYHAKITTFTNLSYALVSSDVEFKDVVNHWSRESVNEMGSRFIVTGVGNGLFLPDNEITRAEMAAMIVKALGIKASGSSDKFPDVAKDQWYFEVVNAAREYGIIKGYMDNTFRPLQKVTREESIAMISRALRLIGAENNLTDVEIQQQLSTFADGKDFADWSRKDAAYAIINKLVVGSEGKLMPGRNIIRAEAAAIILRVLKSSGLL